MEVPMSDVKQAVLALGAPGWKLWITAKKRKAAHEMLVNADATTLARAVHEAVDSGNFNARLRVEDVLKSFEGNRLSTLIQAGRQSRHPQAIELISGVFGAMGPAAARAVPLLMQWLRLEQDPRLNVTGVKELDQVLSDQFRAEHASYAGFENMLMTDVRKAAASALGSIGHEAEQALSVLRRQLERETDEWASRYMKDAIEDIERAVAKKR
jgi:hypothetical protein